MIRRLDSRPPSAPPTPAATSKLAELPKPATPARPMPLSNPAARLNAAAKSEFTPAQASARKVALEVRQPQVTPPQGTPSFRVPQGIVPSAPGRIAAQPGHAAEQLDARGALLGLGGKLAGKPGALDAAGEVLGIGPTPPSEVDMLASEVTEAQEAYDSAIEAKSEAEARLAADLAAYDGVLTEEQRQAYIDAFWQLPENKSKAEAVDKAADELSEVLEENGPELREFAAAGHPTAALALQDAYESLATSDTHADEAIEYTEWLNKSPGAVSILQSYLGEDIQERVGNEILAQAYPRAQSEIFNQYPNDPAGAARAFEELVSGFETGGEFKDLAQDVQELRTQFQALARGDYETAAKNLPTGDSPFQQALKLVEVAQGVFDGAQKLQEGDELGALQGFLEAGRGGLQQSAGLLEIFGRTDLAKNAAELSARLTPILNFAVDAAQLAQDVQDLFEDGANAGEVISAVGSGISVVGDLLWFTPAGPALQALGAVVNGIGGLVEDIIEGSEKREETRKERLELLEAAGIEDEDTRELLANSPRQTELLGNLGLTPDQLIDELRRTTSGEAGDYVQQGYQLAALYGLSGEEALEFARLIENLPPEQANIYLVPSLELAVNQIDWSDPDPEEVRAAQENLLASLTEYFGEEALAPFDLDEASARDANAEYLESWKQSQSERP